MIQPFQKTARPTLIISLEKQFSGFSTRPFIVWLVHIKFSIASSGSVYVAYVYIKTAFLLN